MAQNNIGKSLKHLRNAARARDKCSAVSTHKRKGGSQIHVSETFSHVLTAAPIQSGATKFIPCIKLGPTKIYFDGLANSAIKYSLAACNNCEVFSGKRAVISVQLAVLAD